MKNLTILLVDKIAMNNHVIAAQRATMVVLFCNGLLYSAWGVSVPIIKKLHHLTDGVLSLSMASVAIGGIVTMGFSGRWISMIGSARACHQSGLLMAFFAAPLLMITNYPILLFVLIGFGCVVAANDVAANTQVAYLEKLSDRSLIGLVHGSFSIGGLIGALLASLWFSSALPYEIYFVVIGCFSLLGVWIASQFQINEVKQQSTSQEKNPLKIVIATTQIKRRLHIFGILAFAALVIEGAIYDWATIYIKEVVKAPSPWSGTGYAAFAITMALGRLVSDPIKNYLTHQRIVVWSSLISLIGFSLIISNNSLQGVIPGFLLAGFGVSNLIPLIFSSAGKLAVSVNFPASQALAVTTRIAYTGLLVGPLLIGPLAETIGLRMSFLVLLFMVVTICGGWLLLSYVTNGTPWRITSEPIKQTHLSQSSNES